MTLACSGTTTAATTTAAGPVVTEPVPVTTTIVAATSVAPSTVATTAGPTVAWPPEGFDEMGLPLGDTVWAVALAETPDQRRQGLMGVESLPERSGMLFVFPEDTVAQFWMKDTLIPLDIAFFTAEGSLVDVQTMTPCREDPCPRYSAGAPYRYALEAAAGALAGLTADDRLPVEALASS